MAMPRRVQMHLHHVLREHHDVSRRRCAERERGRPFVRIDHVRHLLVLYTAQPARSPPAHFLTVEATTFLLLSRNAVPTVVVNDVNYGTRVRVRGCNDTRSSSA